jgi:hypothetical protein
VVTGGSGFVGRRIIELLLAEPQKYRITVLDVLLPVVKHANVTYVRGDICNAAHVQAAFQGADAVLHVASIIPSLRTQASPIIQKVNVGGTQVVIDACKVRFRGSFCCCLYFRVAHISHLLGFSHAEYPASSTPPLLPSSSGSFMLTARCLFESERCCSPQDFDLRGVDETIPVGDSASLQSQHLTALRRFRLSILIPTPLPRQPPMLSFCKPTRLLLASSPVSSGNCFRKHSQSCARSHSAPSPAAVFGPGDKLVSDSHVINKGHVVIGSGTALIDWV